MNKFLKKYKFFFLIILLSACSYKPIYSGQNYSFNIGEITFKGDSEINNLIKNKFDLVKDNTENKNVFNLEIETIKNKLIVSNNSKGNPIKFELIIIVNYEIKLDEKLLLKREIKKNNIYDNDVDEFKVERNEKIILENMTEKISEIIISSIVNLDDS